MPRNPSRAQAETIPEDLLESIPVVGKAEASTTFAIESEEVIGSPTGAAPLGPLPAPMSGNPGNLGHQLASQLRYDLGEALARELDRASESFASNIADLESRLQQAEQALMATHKALELERDAREGAEKRLAAFKELALK